MKRILTEIIDKDKTMPIERYDNDEWRPLTSLERAYLRRVNVLAQEYNESIKSYYVYDNVNDRDYPDYINPNIMSFGRAYTKAKELAKLFSKPVYVYMSFSDGCYLSFHGEWAWIVKCLPDGEVEFTEIGKDMYEEETRLVL